MGTQYMMQVGLASGMSATEGMYPAHPKYVDPNLSDPAHMLPENVVPNSRSRIAVRGYGGKDVLIPYLSIGTWAWGDKSTFNYDPTVDLPLIHAAWEKLKSVGLTFVDTAQSYGNGESERICGTLFKGMPRDAFVVQTKWFSGGLSNTLMQSRGPKARLKESLNRLGLDYVDIYLVHGPIHGSSIATVAEGMAECLEEGMTRAVGVANYSTEEMIKMDEELAKSNVPLGVSQCEYSVIRRVSEVSGMIRECKRRGICFQGFASLGEGRLTGKYSRFNEPQSTRRFSSYPMHMLEPTINVLKSIAEEHRVSVSAVALNYSIDKGVVPLVGVRNPEQVEEDMQALGWRLSKDEVRRIEEVSFEGNTSALLQHG
ncbi:putative aldo-keto reductase family protein [Penicillium brasilianum]|uniref:Putative aldo-keto reductase family protein n=1 Tax=Penicillium brasilianum TaxID=104259 RepID=A0A1S9RUJ7_PENBI|nr:putative aldo-keto reductase family protein [Penicillium brasilianum]